MKHLNLELEKLEERIAPWAGGAGSEASKGSKSHGSKSHHSKSTKSHHSKSTK
jgi:hypothetical protein